MLYCSIEDAWGPLPVNTQIETYKKASGLEHFQNSVKKKVNRKKILKKKIYKTKKPVRERFEADSEYDSDDTCMSKSNDNHYIDSDGDFDSREEEEDHYSRDEEEDDEEEDYYEKDKSSETKTINNLKKKINKLIKDNKSLKLKLKEKKIDISNIFDNLITDKNKEIVVMSLIGLMIIIIFHLLLKSTK